MNTTTTTTSTTQGGQVEQVLVDYMDYRDAEWKVEEETGTGGLLEMHLRTNKHGAWRNKHRVLTVVCKSKPTPGVQLKTTSGGFLLAIKKARLDGMSAELRSALVSSEDLKKKRTAFCSEFFLFIK